MMKHVYIAICCLGFVFASGKLAAQSAAPVKKTAIEQLEASFQSQQLRPEQFLAFQKRGEQKFKDFLAFLGFLGSEEIEPLLKAHVQEQVLALFIQDSISCLGKHRVSDLLKNTPEIEWEKDEDIEFRILQEFEKKEDHYLAVLEATTQDKLGTAHRFNFHVYLIWREKSFGEEVIALWEVMLGPVAKK